METVKKNQKLRDRQLILSVRYHSIFGVDYSSGTLCYFCSLTVVIGQGSAADIIKIAMINIYSVIVGVDGPDSSSLLATKFHMLKGRCRILLQVSFEIVSALFSPFSCLNNSRSSKVWAYTIVLNYKCHIVNFYFFVLLMHLDLLLNVISDLRIFFHWKLISHCC